MVRLAEGYGNLFISALGIISTAHGCVDKVVTTIYNQNIDGSYYYCHSLLVTVST